jgi:glycine betaine/proline transport system ATP-binding protein
MQEELMRLQAVLRKTIVFITHDFNEAIRLADRIAIMKDGEIIQSGTPEELVLHPATNYVAEFTRDVQRAKVMSARRLMRPVSKAQADAPRISASSKISSFASDIVQAQGPFIVVDETGAILGEVTREAVIDLLAGRDHPHTESRA